MNKKINKERSEDLFAGMKFVDNMLNEAAGIKAGTPKLSLDQRLKRRLTESTGMEETSTGDVAMEETANLGAEGVVDETTQLESEMDMDESIDEYNYTGDNYNYNYDGKDTQLGEEGIYEEEDPDLLEMLLEDDDLAVEDPTATDMAGAPGDDLGAGMPGDDAAMGGDAGLGADAAMGGDDMGAGLPGDDLGAGDLGGGADLGGAPAMGGAPAGGEMGGEQPATMTATSTMDVTAGPEDIDAMIDALIMENQELKDLGYEDLGDTELTSKVKAGGNKGPKVQIDNNFQAAQTETETVEGALQEGTDTPKSTKLDTQDITGNVKGAGDENKSGDPASANKDLEFTDAKDKDFAGKVKDEKAGTLNQPNFDKVKAESAVKDKALVTLAKKCATLEDEIKRLKLENYKATKVNAILTLLPELKQTTREALVNRFNEAKDFAEARSLYNDVQKMIKENKRPSLNAIVSKSQKGIKHIVNESVENSENNSESAEERRKAFLMGLDGYDEYGK